MHNMTQKIKRKQVKMEKQLYGFWNLFKEN